jgi:serine/threonine-protein kinase
MASDSLIAGKYRLNKKIGRGAMGVVWSALDVGLGREVAIKLLDRQHEVLQARLVREAQACARLDHENVVHVYEVGETAKGEPFLVMELLVGRSLGEHLAEVRRIEPAAALVIARSLGRALRAAHEKGIVHRDLKPDNIFLQRVHDADAPGLEIERVKVLDFGVSKLDLGDGGMSTVTGALVGSPAYMSPEQARGQKGIDGRSDLWSFGVVLFEMIAGRRPFPSTSLRVITEITEDAIPTLASVVPGVDPRLDAIVSRCLTRDVAQRMPSAQALLDALRELATPADRGVSSPALVQGEEPSEDRAQTVVMPRNMAAALASPSRAVTTVAGDPATDATVPLPAGIGEAAREAADAAARTIELDPMGDEERSTVPMAPRAGDVRPQLKTEPLGFQEGPGAANPAAPRFGAPPMAGDGDEAGAAVTTPFVRPKDPLAPPHGGRARGLETRALVGLGVAGGFLLAVLVLVVLTVVQGKAGGGTTAPSAAPVESARGPVPPKQP